MLFYINKIINNQFKNLKFITKNIKNYSANVNRLSYDSDLVSKFLKRLSTLYEEDKTKLVKTFSDYDFAQLENIYNFHNYLRKTDNEIEQLKSLLEG